MSERTGAKRGFTLIEMLVVIGIITVLIGVSIGGYAKMTKSAERAKVQELVSNAATALTAYFQAEGAWPKRIQNGNGRLDKDQALVIARGYLSMSTDASDSRNAKKLTGVDRFGVVTPWAQAVIRKLGVSATESSMVTGSSTVQDHILYYSVDLDGDGVISGSELRNLEGVEQIRATAAVWSCNAKGESPNDYAKGRKGDFVYSFTYGQTQK